MTDVEWMSKARSTFSKWADKRGKTPSDFFNNTIRKNNTTWKKELPNNWALWKNGDYGDLEFDVKKKKEIVEVEIYREIDESEYIIITPRKIEKEIGSLNEKILDRMNDMILTCINCGMKDVFTNFLGASLTMKKGDLVCPNCESRAVGVPEENKERWISEILKGDGSEEEN